MKKLLLSFFLILTSLFASATHLRGGYISVKRMGVADSRKCEITVTVYTDTNCSQCILFGGDTDELDFGDGTFMHIPETPNSPVAGMPNVGVASFTIVHTYGSNGRYTISYQEANRNEGVINMDNSLGTTFYVETMVDLSSANFSSTPDFLITPIFRAKLGSELTISAGAVSTQDHILLYQLGTPQRERNTPVQNYQLPENISINPFNGLITWDTKFNNLYQAGEYSFNVRVTLLKEIEGEFYPVCTVMKDVQIILEDVSSDLLTSTNIEFDANNRLYVPTDETKTIKIFFEKENTEATVELSVASELALNGSAFSFSSYDSSSLPNIKVGVLTLTSTAGINRENPYLITIRGKYSNYAKDVSILFFTQDVQPKLIDIIDIITEAEAEQKAVQVYPNPSRDFFHFAFAENQPAAISIHDLNGKLVHVSFIQGPTSLDLRHLKSGLYYCTISSGSTLRRIKLLKD